MIIKNKKQLEEEVRKLGMTYHEYRALKKCAKLFKVKEIRVTKNTTLGSERSDQASASKEFG